MEYFLWKTPMVTHPCLILPVTEGVPTRTDCSGGRIHTFDFPPGALAPLYLLGLD